MPAGNGGTLTAGILAEVRDDAAWRLGAYGEASYRWPSGAEAFAELFAGAGRQPADDRAHAIAQALAGLRMRF